MHALIKRIVRSLTILFCLSTFGGCLNFASLKNGSSNPLHDPGTQTVVGPKAIVFDPTAGHQVMEGFGADAAPFVYANQNGWDWDKVKYVFDELDLHFVRSESWFSHWELFSQAVAQPGITDFTGFDPYYTIHNHDLPFAKYLADRNIESSLGIWGVPDWLSGGSASAIAPGRLQDFGNMIASYLSFLKQNGVHEKVIEVWNEPSPGSGFPNPEALRDTALAVLDELDRFGLNDVDLHGPNLPSPVDVDKWAEPWLQNERLRSRTAAVSFHTYWSEDLSNYDKIKAIAEKYDKPVWVTEDNLYGAGPDWVSGFNAGKSMYYGVSWAHATRIYHWSVVGWDAAISPTGERMPTFYVLKHFANFIPPGSRFIETTSEDTAVYPLAFQLPDGRVSLVVMNIQYSPRTMKLSDALRSKYRVAKAITSTDGSYEQPTSYDASADGSELELHLPATSITSLILEPL